MARTAAAARVAGLGLTFAGGATTDNINFTRSAVSDQPLKSIAFWALFNTAGGSNTGRIMTWSGARFKPGFSSSARITLVQTATGPGSWQYIVNANFGSWHHYALTYDRSGGTPLAAVPILYVDGVAVTWTSATQPTGTITADSGTVHIIGNTQVTGGAQALDGTLANFYAYTRILTPDEIVGLMQGIDPDPTSLELKLRFTEGAGLVSANEASPMKSVILGATWAAAPQPLQRVTAAARVAAGARSAA